MCTLTYLPTGKNSFIWTQNRDESPLRTASELVHQKGERVYPKEPLKGGTWISIAKNNRVVSLLNGAFEKQPYVFSTKRSRGLIVLDFLDYAQASDFFEQYDLEGVEPFTMVVYEDGVLWDFRWDKTQKYVQQLDVEQAHIWSSSMLYTAEMKAARREWFGDYLEKNKEHTVNSALDFHQHAGIGNIEYDLIMKRPYVETVSITNIVKESNTLALTYHDLVNQKVSSQAL